MHVVVLMLLLSTGKTSAQYCNPSFTYGCTSSDYIQSFSTTGGITNISNPGTGCAVSSGISTYLTKVLTVNPGMIVGFTFVNTPSFGEYYAIFIDYNGDGDFVDAGETAVGFPYLSYGATYTSTFTVPLTALPGTTRMRVMCVYATSSFAPCGSYAFGEIEDYTVQITSPCPKPVSLPATNVNSQSATINWNPLAGSLKYDYIVDSVTPGAAITTLASTTNTTANVAGLKPNSVHYARVRSYCTPTGFSLWDTMVFTTLPPCAKPSGFVASNVDSNSADLTWSKPSNVLQFKYVLDRSRNTPGPNAVTNTTTASFVGLPDTLKEGTWYYMHIKAMCVVNDSSVWSLDSFRTPVPCRKPQLTISYLSAGNAVVFWPAVNTAYTYEYYLGPLTTLPANGTPILIPTLQMPYLVPSTAYTLSVRAMCNDYGIVTNSGWASIDFTSKGVSVASLNAENTSFKAYPNPVKDVLSIELINRIEGKASISVIDITGKTVRQVEVNQSRLDINMGGLANGVYQVKFTDASHTDIISVNKQ